MPSAVPRVHFATTAQSSRLPRDDEIYVMKQFANHAGRCRFCSQPYVTFASGLQLCDRGQVYAKDVSQYIYSKGGKAFSLIDRKDTDQRIQIEVPRGCDVIHDLLKAVDKGMRLPKHKPVITQEPINLQPQLIERRPKSSGQTTPVARRSSTSAKRDSGVFITSQAKKDSGVYIKPRGSLYRKDAAARLRRNSDEEEPIIIRASPGVRVREYYR